MANFGLIIATILVLGASFSKAQHVLKCWRCSSDTSTGSFCVDPFDQDLITPQQKYWSYANCTGSGPAPGPNMNYKPVCKKLVQEIYGKTVVSRSCFWEDYNDAADKCQYDPVPSYVKTVYCRTCSTDGCNSAGAFVPIATLVMIPAVLSKLISL